MRDLIRYAIHRLGWLVVTLWLVYTVSFVLMRSVPGSPFGSERTVPPAIERQLRARYNLDSPPLKQYIDYAWGIISRGDLVMNLVALLTLPAIIKYQDNDGVRLSIAGVALVILVISIMFSRRKSVSMVAA